LPSTACPSQPAVSAPVAAVVDLATLDRAAGTLHPDLAPHPSPQCTYLMISDPTGTQDANEPRRGRQFAVATGSGSSGVVCNPTCRSRTPWRELELLTCLSLFGGRFINSAEMVLRPTIAVVSLASPAFLQRPRHPARVSSAEPSWCGSRLALGWRWPRWRGHPRPWLQLVGQGAWALLPA
jgi:hypothetical protein